MNRILIITDKKKSSENQAFSISNELIKKNRNINIIHKKIDKSFFHFLPNKLIYLYLICQNFFKKDEFFKNINLIISCGRIAAPHSLFLKKKLNCKNCHILNPYFAHKSFDKIIVPEHDINKFNSSDNLIVTKGTLVNLSKLKSKIKIDDKIKGLFPRKKKKILILIGGDGKSSKVGINDIKHVIDKIVKLSSKFIIIFCFSRRTSPLIKNFIIINLNKNCFYFPKNEFNPYWELLSISDYIFVTEDSVSMTSDALSTGKPTYIISVRYLKKKIKEFQNKLLRKGFTRLFSKNLESWKYKKFSESKIVCKKVSLNFHI